MMSKGQDKYEMTDKEKELFGLASDNASHPDGGVKTLSALKAEWGMERFVPALGQVSQWFLSHPHPHPVPVMMTLLDESRDAFTVYLSLLMHGANS